MPIDTVRGTVLTYDGRRTVDYMTPEGQGYSASEYLDFQLWRRHLPAADYVLEEQFRPEVGKEFSIWGVLAQTGFGTIRVYIVDPDGSIENISDNSISDHYIFPSGANVLVKTGGHVAVTTAAALTGAAWLHIYGKTV